MTQNTIKMDLNSSIFRQSQYMNEYFNLDDFNKGREVIYRNGERPLYVVYFETSDSYFPIVSVDIRGKSWDHSIKGDNNPGLNSPFDLLHPIR